MNAVIIFEVSGNDQLLVKSRMLQAGYHSTWKSGGISFNIPSNIVWRPDKDLQQALNDLTNTISVINSERGSTLNPIQLLRCLVLSAIPWMGIEGTPITT